ncbi:MAG: hypothetical protein HYW65_00455 [Candidatus Liptonbacteria bacterium]|nr:hypothetical protein [Candidatus Liptonbacteria bacterium]
MRTNEELKVGDRVVTIRKLRFSLINKEIPAGTLGFVARVPSHPTSVHVRFEGVRENFLLDTRHIRRESDPPSIMEKIRLFLQQP